MGLFDSLRKLVGSVDTEYDRRIKSASSVTTYDPTGASHHHDHVEVHNEHVESVETTDSHNGHTVMAASTPDEQSNPRKVTHSGH